MNGKKGQRDKPITGCQGFLLLTLFSQHLPRPALKSEAPSIAAVEFTQHGNLGWEVGAPSPLRRAGLCGRPLLCGCADRKTWLYRPNSHWPGRSLPFLCPRILGRTGSLPLECWCCRAGLQPRGGCEGQELHIETTVKGDEAICSDQAGRRTACGQQA